MQGDIFLLEDQVDRTGRSSDVVKPRGCMVALMVPAFEERDVAESGGWDPYGPETWTDPLHCTLSYIKECDNISSVVNAVRKAVKSFPAFPLVTTRANFFFKEDESVHYVGAAAPELDALVGAIRHQLNAAGIEHDRDFPVFTPHITIEYMDDSGSEAVSQRLQRSVEAPPVSFYPTLEVVDGSNRTLIPWATDGIGIDEPLGASESMSALFALAQLEDAARKHDNDPTLGRSALHQHMARAVFQSLKQKGDGAKDAAKGALKITQHQLQKYGYQGRGDAGRLTGKGANRSRKHAQEPGGQVAAKASDYKAIAALASK